MPLPQKQKHASTALGMTDGRDVQFLAAMTYSFAGDSAKAQLLTSDFVRRFPRPS